MKNNRQLKKYFVQVPIFILETVSSSIKELFTVKELSKSTTFLVCSYCALKAANLEVPLYEFFYVYGGKLVEAFVIYLILYLPIFLLIFSFYWFFEPIISPVKHFFVTLINLIKK